MDDNYANTASDVEPFSGVTPYKEHFLEQMEYLGPGRYKPEPEDIDSVKIGFIGPIMATVSVATGGGSQEIPLGIQMLQGARLAVEQANERGGYLKRSLPFELVVSNDNGLWGASGNEIVDMAYKDKVWAILGTIDGANSHIAIRVALKAEITMMNSGDTDPTFIETNIPWVFRCISDDRQMSYLLADYLFRKQEYKRVGVIRSSSRYGRFGIREVRDSARRLGRPIALEMAYPLGEEDFSLQLERLQAAGTDAIVHWGNAEAGAKILKQMREMDMDQPFYGCDRHVSDAFLDIAGDYMDNAMFVYPWNPDRDDPKLDAFSRDFQERFGIEPDTYAAHGYDGMNMLIWAVQVAGLNRAKIRDVLAYREKPWPGVVGDIKFSAALTNNNPTTLTKFVDGKWKFFTRKALDIPMGYIPPLPREERQAAAISD
jgi:ABC-type branched-subunit amino acid transport system substrate-binding protein